MERFCILHQLAVHASDDGDMDLDDAGNGTYQLHGNRRKDPGKVYQTYSRFIQNRTCIQYMQFRDHPDPGDAVCDVLVNRQIFIKQNPKQNFGFFDIGGLNPKISFLLIGRLEILLSGRFSMDN